MPLILVIDSGNSFFKWGIKNEDNWMMRSSIANAEFSTLSIVFLTLPKPDFIAIAHVSHIISDDQIRELISIWPVRPLWIQAKSSQCGVVNCYNDPVLLGSDRWAALIAAWKNQRQACLIVNAGTAVTIDALSHEGKFLGGVILPGVRLMRDSLRSNTRLIRNENGIYQDFPDNTNNAIQSGIIHCLIGAIDRMYRLLAAYSSSSNLICVLSGGDASIITPYIKNPVNIIDYLVLEGLAAIVEENVLNQ